MGIRADSAYIAKIQHCAPWTANVKSCDFAPRK
jgi:hypothetical protein